MVGGEVVLRFNLKFSPITLIKRCLIGLVTAPMGSNSRSSDDDVIVSRGLVMASVKRNIMLNTISSGRSTEIKV